MTEREHEPKIEDETGRNLTNSMLLWTPVRYTDIDNQFCGAMELVQWPLQSRANPRLRMSWGACNSEVRDAEAEQRKGLLAANLLTIAVRDGISIDRIHAACWPLDEYRALFPGDVPSPSNMSTCRTIADSETSTGFTTVPPPGRA